MRTRLTLGSNRPGHHAFTLVELLIVVAILGIIAAIVVPSSASASDDAAASALAMELRNYQSTASQYMILTGQLLEDSASGEIPAGFEPYIRPALWLDGTAAGGVWDTELNSFGVTSAIGVHFNGTGVTRDDAFMTRVDAYVDDGNLSTGLFQKLDADRYYVILVP